MGWGTFPRTGHSHGLSSELLEEESGEGTCYLEPLTLTLESEISRVILLCSLTATWYTKPFPAPLLPWPEVGNVKVVWNPSLPTMAGFG